jgi:hypothetical protein
MLEFESSPESPYAQSPKHLIFTAAREATYVTRHRVYRYRETPRF